MTDSFFERPVLNSPYAYPARHWELDADGQPTNRIIDNRRRSELITPVPKPQKRRRAASQGELGLSTGDGLSTPEQEYNPTPIINEIRGYVAAWRNLPNPNQWQVTPETARLLQYWRHHQFESFHPFFCNIEAVETAIWLAEVASDRAAAGARIWTHLRGANKEANPELLRIALKLRGASLLPREAPSRRCRKAQGRRQRGGEKEQRNGAAVDLGHRDRQAQARPCRCL